MTKTMNRKPSLTANALGEWTAFITSLKSIAQGSSHHDARADYCRLIRETSDADLDALLRSPMGSQLNFHALDCVTCIERVRPVWDRAVEGLSPACRSGFSKLVTAFQSAPQSLADESSGLPAPAQAPGKSEFQACGSVHRIPDPPLIECVRELADPNPDIRRAGAAAFEYLKASDFDGYRKQINDLAHLPCIPDYKQNLFRNCDTSQARMCAHFENSRCENGRCDSVSPQEAITSVSPQEAITLIADESAPVSLLAESESLRISLARVRPRGKNFPAAILKLNARDHVILVRGDAEGEEFYQYMDHEFSHIKDVRKPKEEPPMSLNVQRSSSRPDAAAPPVVLFAIAQLNVDAEDKQLAAKWVARELPLASGAGLFLDAGTSCREMWNQIMEEIKDRYANLAIATNNLLVIKEWIDGLMRVPALQGTSLETAGEICDVSHLAYYGEALRKKLMSRNMSFSAIYIGASGIEFHEEGGIRLSYHAGDPERQFKELLFRCPCSTKGARVILASPVKIGNPGGRVLDILSIKDMDTSVPIYLVTAEPKQDDKDAQGRFKRAKDILCSQRMTSRLTEKGVEFHWVIVDRENVDTLMAKEHLVYPVRASGENQLSTARHARKQKAEHSHRSGPAPMPAAQP